MGKKFNELKKLSGKERDDRIKELRIELIKKNAAANKGSKIKTKEIKKAIARLLTLSAKNTNK